MKNQCIGVGGRVWGRSELHGSSCLVGMFLYALSRCLFFSLLFSLSLCLSLTLLSRVGVPLHTVVLHIEAIKGCVFLSFLLSFPPSRVVLFLLLARYVFVSFSLSFPPSRVVWACIYQKVSVCLFRPVFSFLSRGVGIPKSYQGAHKARAFHTHAHTHKYA